MNDPIHALIIGKSGDGKSHLAATSATAESPQLVAAFDSIGNIRPYLEIGDIVARDQVRDSVMLGSKPSVIPTYLIYTRNEKGEEVLLRKIWHFGAAISQGSLDVQNPEGIQQWQIKMPKLIDEMQAIGSSTFVLDSTSLFHIMVRRKAKFSSEGLPGQNNQNERSWAYAVTDYFEDVCLALSLLRVSTLVIGHPLYDEKTGVFLGLNAPGRMHENAFYMFSDLWYCFIDQEGKNKVKTRGDAITTAKNSIHADEICDNNFQALTRNSKPIEWRRIL